MQLDKSVLSAALLFAAAAYAAPAPSRVEGAVLADRVAEPQGDNSPQVLAHGIPIHKQRDALIDHVPAELVDRVAAPAPAAFPQAPN